MPWYGTIGGQPAEQKFSQWASTLRGLRQTLLIAIEAKNVLMQAQVRAAIKWILGELNAAKVEAQRADAPSSVMLALDRFSDEALSIGKQVGEGVGTAAKGLGGLVAALPKILPLALGVALIMAVVRVRRELRR